MALFRLRLVPDDTSFKFMEWRLWSFPLSAFLSILTVLLFFGVGLTFGIDFKGGTLVELQATSGQADIADVRTRANALGFGSVEVQAFGTPADLLLRVEVQEGGEPAQQNVVDQLRRTFGESYEFRRVEVVGPRVSGELVQAGTIGIVVAIFGILVYLWFRFEWQFAVAAVITTVHDVVLSMGFFMIMGLTFDMTSIAVILTILGYSLNDTVVVFDRVRETMRKYKKMSIVNLLDNAVNATLGRTVITSVTTLLAMAALAAFGGETLWGFSITMLFGAIAGTYSTTFIAAPLLIYLGLRQGSEAAEKAEKAERKVAAGSAAKA